MSDLIQTIARAMWDAREQCMPERTRMKWEAGTDGAKSFCWLMAEEALTAINEAGLVIVPRVPSEAMVKASGMVDDEYYFATQESADNHAREIYSAMIAAITTGETGNG